MRRICDELREVDYLDRIVVVVGRATWKQVLEAGDFFRGFVAPVTLLWMEDPRVVRLLRILVEHGFPVQHSGKGQTCWLSFGYTLARGESDAVVLHDCDIANYSRELLARLCYPVTHPDLGFDFCKGFYARTSDRLNGRVTRLFLTPLLRVLRRLRPDSRFLSFLEDFRYPLAGEIGVSTSLLEDISMPTDWGMEAGMLFEVMQKSRSSGVCQVDIADSYDHKHQDLSFDRPDQGLRRMSADIGRTLFRSMAAEGSGLDAAELVDLDVRYQRSAQQMICRYEADAVMNGLRFDRAAEQVAVEGFRQSVREAARRSTCGEFSFLLPPWSTVRTRFPSVLPDLLECGMEPDAGTRSYLTALNAYA